MVRWARVSAARNWHLTTATATTDLRRTVCGFMLRPADVLPVGQLPAHDQHCCSACLRDWVSEGSDTWLRSAFGQAER